MGYGAGFASANGDVESRTPIMLMLSPMIFGGQIVAVISLDASSR